MEARDYYAQAPTRCGSALASRGKQFPAIVFHDHHVFSRIDTITKQLTANRQITRRHPASYRQRGGNIHVF
jgi:hypothetical protein